MTRDTRDVRRRSQPEFRATKWLPSIARGVGAVVGASVLLVACAVDDPGSTANTGATEFSNQGDPPETPDKPGPRSGRVVTIDRVVDGDTIIVEPNERVRLIGIDTPESVKPDSPEECFGAEASRRLSALLPPGTEVVLVADVESQDRFERSLAYVYRRDDDLFVNAALIDEGFAFAYTVPPNVAFADEFVDLQRTARREGRGLWSACPSG